MPRVVHGPARRARLPAPEARHSMTAVLALFAFGVGGVAIAVMASADLVTRQPFVFPSLGLACALMVWIHGPHPPACSTTLIVSLGLLREPAADCNQEGEAP
jgi:hypothetical protein